MARFVMANRRSGKFSEALKRRSRDSIDSFVSHSLGGVDVLGDLQPDDQASRRVVVFEADESEVAGLVASSPTDVLVEPEILHFPLSVHALPLDLQDLEVAMATGSPAPPAGAGSLVQVAVVGDQNPLPFVEVALYLRLPSGVATKLTAQTDAMGLATFAHSAAWVPLAAVVTPVGGYWPRVVRGTAISLPVELPPLPMDGPLAWWHRLHDVSAYDPTRGDGIRVGVIDSGCGPHPALAHAVDAGAFIDGNVIPGAGAGVDSHGSHVCGLIGARPVRIGDYAGIAPGVALFSARVFPGPGTGANQGDIANAIDALSRDHGVDLINLSLGAKVGSQIEQDAILDALERGTVCVCAAGNSNGPVQFPAAFPESVAITAIGYQGWAPAGTISADRYPDTADRHGANNLFHANFSCYGPEVDAGAAGVGIISTVPERDGFDGPYGAMDGTSMASPLACGALAALLTRDADYLGLARDRTRADKARAILSENVGTAGLKPVYQGGGVPKVR